MVAPIVVSTLARAAGTYLAKKGAKKALKKLPKAQRKPIKKNENAVMDKRQKEFEKRIGKVLKDKGLIK